MVTTIEDLNKEWQNHIKDNRLLLLLEFDENVKDLLCSIHFKNPSVCRSANDFDGTYKGLPRHNYEIELGYKMIPGTDIIGKYEFSRYKDLNRTKSDLKTSIWLKNINKITDSFWFESSNFSIKGSKIDKKKLEEFLDYLFNSFDLKEKIIKLDAVRKRTEYNYLYEHKGDSSWLKQ